MKETKTLYKMYSFKSEEKISRCRRKGISNTKWSSESKDRKCSLDLGRLA
jgi:hypothetical protein